MRIRAFRPADLATLAAPDGPGLQAAQAYLGPGLSSATGAALAAGGPAFTATGEGGRPICCIGLVEHWEGRALAWAVLGAGAGRHLVAITRAVRRFLALAPWRRIEAAVECGFAPGHRWARLLGFALEAERMTAWSGERDFALYAHVRTDARPENSIDQGRAV